jgi:hypothetical protein
VADTGSTIISEFSASYDEPEAVDEGRREVGVREVEVAEEVQGRARNLRPRRAHNIENT